MQPFDPRTKPVRYTPRLMLLAAVVGAMGFGWRELDPAPAMAATGPVEGGVELSPAAMAALEHRAFAAAGSRDGMVEQETVPVRIQSGETFEDAVMRTGVSGDEARQVVGTLASAFDTVNIRAGLSFDAALARSRRGPVRLIGLSMRTGPASAITISRTFDGALRLRELSEATRDETTVAAGSIHGSLYASASRAGADARITAEVVGLFARQLDFSRDIKAGDQFRLVFDRTVTESGRVIETGELLYAEIEAKGDTTRFYRFDRGERPEWFDENGRNMRGFLLRTPIDGARISSNFGMRRHPISGYHRMHQGIDFAAGSGTPVVTAGDGVVVEARRWGGYGNWVRVRHTDGWETGYAHLSSYARGLRPGMRVAQGQVVGYVGSTGASTGPHLHYEIWRSGGRVNPIGALIPQGTVLAGMDLRAFQARKNRVDALLASAPGQENGRLEGDLAPSARQASLRPAMTALAPTVRRG